MSARVFSVLVVGILCSVQAAAEPRQPLEQAPEPPTNKALPELVNKLHTTVKDIEGDINAIPLFELLQRITKSADVQFVVDEESFRAVGEQDVKSKTPTIAATRLRGLTLHQLLTTVLESMGATYTLRGNTIEIVPPEHAAKLTKSSLTSIGEGRRKLSQPLVCAVLAEKPLNEALAQIAERYDLTVIVSPQTGDARSAFVTARLLNTPADQAIDLLALQADLRVVRKGAAFFITSREHAEELFNEHLEKQRRLIELEKFRQMPPPRPEAPPPRPEGQLKAVPGMPGVFELKLNVVPPKP